MRRIDGCTVAIIDSARISTRPVERASNRHTDAFRGAGCDRIAENSAGGVHAGRLGLAADLDPLRKGDVLVVLNLDRLGQRSGELIGLVDEPESRYVGFRSLKLFKATTAAGRAFLQVQAPFAEMERKARRGHAVA